jgi:hypothetical protein
VVHDFTSFLFRLPLSPTIPDYFYTMDRRITVPQALAMAEQEVTNVLKLEDQTWAEEARSRLQEELDILAAYYEELARREPESAEKESEDVTTEEENIEEEQLEEQPATVPDQTIHPASSVSVEQPQSFDEYRATGGRILDFLRANGIQVTPREEINQKEWRKSTPDEERQRRMDELRWQHEPRIDVQFINGGLFYLSSTPPLVSTSQLKNTSKSPVSGRIL